MMSFKISDDLINDIFLTLGMECRVAWQQEVFDAITFAQRSVYDISGHIHPSCRVLNRKYSKLSFCR